MAEPIQDDVQAELKALLPPVREVVVAGETVTVRPLAFEQIPLVLPRMAVLLSLVEDGPASVLLAGPERMQDIRALLALCTGKPEDWFSGLDAQAGLELVTAAVEANEGFFLAVLRALPRLADVVNRLATAAPAGPPSPRT